MYQIIKIHALITVAALTAGATLAPLVHADEMAELKAKFAASDTNHDGKLTLAEAKEGGMRKIVRGFDKIDAAASSVAKTSPGGVTGSIRVARIT